MMPNESVSCEYCIERVQLAEARRQRDSLFSDNEAARVRIAEQEAELKALVSRSSALEKQLEKSIKDNLELRVYLDTVVANFRATSDHLSIALDKLREYDKKDKTPVCEAGV